MNFKHECKIFQDGLELPILIDMFRVMFNGKNNKKLFVRTVINDKQEKFLTYFMKGKIFTIKYSVGGAIKEDCKECRVLKYDVIAVAGEIGHEEIVFTGGLKPYIFR